MGLDKAKKRVLDSNMILFGKSSLRKLKDRSLFKVLLSFLALVFVFLFLISRSQAQIPVNGSIEYKGEQRILNLWGTNYEMGYAQGHLLADEIMDLIEEFMIGHQLGGREASFDKRASEVETKFYFPPEYEEELQGVLAGMEDSGKDIYLDLKGRNVNLLDLKMWNTHPDFVCACSSLAVWGEASVNGETIDARNFDSGHDQTYGYYAQYTLLKTVEPDDSSLGDWLSVGWPGFIGAVSGMNEHGVKLTLNCGGHRVLDPEDDQYRPYGLLFRESLEEADETNAIDYLYNFLTGVDSLPIRGSLNIHLSLPFQRMPEVTSVVLETDGFGTNIRHSDYDFPEYDHIIATNHFAEQEMPTSPKQGSIWRYNRIANLLINKYETGDGKVDPSEAREIVGEVGGRQTSHTIVMRPNEMGFDLSIAKVIGTNPLEVIGAPQVDPEYYSWPELFPNHEEDATPPVISDIQATNVTDSRATVTWNTDEVSNSVVNYGTTPILESAVSDPTMVTSHSIVLTGLTAETTYYYEVQSTDSAGNTATDNNDGLCYTFIAGTAPNQPPVADGGPDQTVMDSDGDGFEEVILDGSASFDPGGTITTYHWQEGGVLLGTAATLTHSFSVGSHSLTLIVFDNEGASGTDDVLVTVNPNEIIIDNRDSAFSTDGFWATYSRPGDYYGDDFRYALKNWSTRSATWSLDIFPSGDYQVYAMWMEHPAHSTDVGYQISYNGQTDTVLADQTQNGGNWNLLGTYYFDSERTDQKIIVTNKVDTGTYVITADAVRLVPTF